MLKQLYTYNKKKLESFSKHPVSSKQSISNSNRNEFVDNDFKIIFFGSNILQIIYMKTVCPDSKHSQD